jgi:hypothetical protein
VVGVFAFILLLIIGVLLCILLCCGGGLLYKKLMPAKKDKDLTQVKFEENNELLDEDEESVISIRPETPNS